MDRLGSGTVCRATDSRPLTQTSDPTMRPTFDIDVRGLQQTILKDASRVLLEPLTNALDTDATEITVSFAWARGFATYIVEDNAPQGFEDLADAWTLFAPSRRKAVATARGRFGFGEKELVALCYPEPVTVATTTGTVTFRGKSRSVRRGARDRRPEGTAVTARVRLTRQQADDFLNRLRTVLVPDGVTLNLEIEGLRTRLTSRPAVRSCETVLPIVLAGPDGSLRNSRRKTQLTLHEVQTGEEATLYELGMPVMAHSGPWHINIAQKVPLSRGRDSVTDSYMRAVHVAALDAAADLLTAEMARADWVVGALAAASPDTVKTIVHLTYGSDAVIADPSCPEATKRATEEGRSVIYGGAYGADTWKLIKEHSLILPAGHHPELRRDLQMGPDGIPPVPAAEWRPEWRAVAAYAAAIGLELLERPIAVTIHRQPYEGWLAACGPTGELLFNAGRLARKWWTDEQAIDELLIHELAHVTVLDHLTDAYHEECCRLGARIRNCQSRLAHFTSIQAAA